MDLSNSFWRMPCISLGYLPQIDSVSNLRGRVAVDLAPPCCLLASPLTLWLARPICFPTMHLTQRAYHACLPPNRRYATPDANTDVLGNRNGDGIQY